MTGLRGKPRRAYPRVRGGTGVVFRVDGTAEGLSPRPRGNRPAYRYQYRREGPIPASAGEPRSTTRSSAAPRAYPRVRGGTSWKTCCPGVSGGLSPRPRGNHAGGGVSGVRQGPIPASAGEPSEGRTMTCTSRAYPRVRGGTPAGQFARHPAQGLSPRPRGNH